MMVRYYNRKAAHMFNYRILYGGKTLDGKWTESQLEFESEDEVKTEDDLIDVMRTIGLQFGYSEVALKKIELALSPDSDEDGNL